MSSWIFVKLNKGNSEMMTWKKYEVVEIWRNEYLKVAPFRLTEIGYWVMCKF